VIADGITAGARMRPQAYDLIVLDVMLPGKTGLELCREFRRVDERTPVILLTARTLEEDRIGGLDAGANDYVTKPFSPRELAARARGLLRYATWSRRAEHRLDDELRRARDVQQTLLPAGHPDVEALEYACVSRPATPVSGDYFDFTLLPSGRFAFLVADVAGKGMPAALLGASIHATIRAAPLDTLILERANRAIFDESACGRFVTVFFAIFDPVTRRLTYANVGHYPPFLTRAGGIVRLDALTPPVGMFAVIQPEEVTLDPFDGDTLVVTSDGIPEAFDENGQEFGDQRVEAIIGAWKGAGTVDLCRRIVDDAVAFAAGTPADDITVLSARVLTKS
jgi:sigma-B regulation protein RsbU (phosphoserine phosphatase)